MIRVHPGSARSTITEDGRELRIVIPPRRNWFLLLFLSAWLGLWILTQVTVPFQLLETRVFSREMWFLAIWLLMWTLGSVVALYIWLWNLTGREIVVVDGRDLVLKRDLLGFGRERAYDLAHVANLRVSSVPSIYLDPKAGLHLWGIGGGLLAFDYGAKTYRFGNSIDEAEANLLLRSITERIGGRTGDA